MQTLRGTLTVWYTAALAAAVLAFGITITILQGRAADSAQEVRLAALANRVTAVMAERATDGAGKLLDYTFAGPRVSPLRSDVQLQLSLIPGLVLVIDTANTGIYGSPDAQRFTLAAADRLRERLAAIRGNEETFAMTLDGASYAFVARRADPRTRGIRAVTVGEPSTDPAAALQQLGTTVLLVFPFILVMAGLLGWLLSSRALRPVSRMIDELEAITDGRSLHRRLPGGPQAEELSRLSRALNALLARLETSFDAMRRFVADASHEMKTPLMVMRAGVERTLTDPKTSPEALLPLEETLVGVRHMTELVDALLTLARVDEGRMELHREPVNLGGLMDETYETAQILGEEAGVEVALELPADPVIVEADGGRIRQLVMNLITNAVKYTPSGGRVWLTLTATPQAATISVRDTGIGIAPGDVARVFDRFWRADPARSRTGERPGIGLGLAISKWIAEAHGGSIAVTSRPQRGSTFTVTLPRQPGAAAPAAMTASVTES
jgi:two-component system OmpR family sensor kinase